MPLSQPAERERLHTRAIEINGYRRADGRYDIEAHLTDSKSFGQTNFDRGSIEAGEPIHDMWLRLTSTSTMRIMAVEAVSDKTPYVMCPTAAPNFARLVGMQIKAGFLRDATHAVGGTLGCTHLRELLQQMATTAFQTINPAKARPGDGGRGRPTTSPAATLSTRGLPRNGAAATRSSILAWRMTRRVRW